MNFNASCRILLSILIISSVSFGEQSGDLKFSFSAFGDAQFQVGGSDPDNSPTFVINDGALYLSAERGNTSAMIDLPFKFNGGDGVSRAANHSDGNNFQFGKGKAQFFISHSYDIGLSWTIGQFDTLYGYELNDTKDIFFTNPGIVFNGALRTSHTGLMAAMKFNDQYELKLLAANAQNEGKRSQANFEYGAQFLFNPGHFYGAIGYLHHRNLTKVDEYLIDFLIGASFGDLTIDFEFDAVKPAAGNPKGIAMMGHFVYAATDKVSLGLRAEYLNKVGDNANEYQFTAGPKVQLTDELTGKLDYTFNSAEATIGASRTETHSGALSAIYMFKLFTGK